MDWFIFNVMIYLESLFLQEIRNLIKEDSEGVLILKQSMKSNNLKRNEDVGNGWYCFENLHHLIYLNS